VPEACPNSRYSNSNLLKVSHLSRIRTRGFFAEPPPTQDLTFNVSFYRGHVVPPRNSFSRPPPIPPPLALFRDILPKTNVGFVPLFVARRNYGPASAMVKFAPSIAVVRVNVRYGSFLRCGLLQDLCPKSFPFLVSNNKLPCRGS